ncbi:MAG: endolytic transglycosylase MltG [Chlorobi bacterium]|nr:endolytic transglycosylase MltG [Chlorobiota bacterium]
MEYRSRTRNKKRYLVFVIFTVLLLAGALAGYRLYNYIYTPNVFTPGNKDVLVFIPSNSTFDDVVMILKKNGYLNDEKAFVWVARKKKYTENIKGGCYTIRDKMSNNDLVNLLRSGVQTPVKVTFNNIRTLEQLAGHIAKRLEPDSADLITLMKDSAVISQYGFTPETFIAMFIPNTYEFYWTTSARKFLNRMHSEYQKFWKGKREEKAEAIGLTPVEVSTLASIVDEETAKEDEKPVVAGLYINRLKRGMRLQADPTIKFALGDFSVKRILNKDLKIDSPYNTYLYAGLPPGPIRIASIQGIDAVLNYKRHNYLYMCAKEDFSGYHNFASTLKQHNVYAARYRKALREKRIWR